MNSNIYRVKEGSIFAGACSGLEASGKGTAVMWRLLFFFTGWFSFLGVIAYVALAIILPEGKSKKKVQELTKQDACEELSADEIEMELSKLKSMLDNQIISEEEFHQLRKKALSIG